MSWHPTGGTILIWGDTGTGKTLDVAHCFGMNAHWFLAEPDGLASAWSNLGFMPPHHVLVDLDDPMREVEAIMRDVVRPGVVDGSIKAIVMDTMSEFADRLLTREKMFVKDARLAYNETAERLTHMIRLFQLTGVWVVAICHVVGPKERRGLTFRGGPALPGKETPNKVSGMFSLILRADVDRKTRRYVYRCDPFDANFITKDRYGVAKRVQELDLRPLLAKYIDPDGDEVLFEPKPIRLLEAPVEVKVSSLLRLSQGISATGDKE